MAKAIKVWYDAEGDFLEVLFSDKPGHMQETNHDAVMERVGVDGDILGFTVMQVSKYRGERSPVVAELV